MFSKDSKSTLILFFCASKQFLIALTKKDTKRKRGIIKKEIKLLQNGKSKRQRQASKFHVQKRIQALRVN